MFPCHLSQLPGHFSGQHPLAHQGEQGLKSSVSGSFLLTQGLLQAGNRPTKGCFPAARSKHGLASFHHTSKNNITFTTHLVSLSPCPHGGSAACPPWGTVCINYSVSLFISFTCHERKRLLFRQCPIVPGAVNTHPETGSLTPETDGGAGWRAAESKHYDIEVLHDTTAGASKPAAGLAWTGNSSGQGD